MKVNILIFKWLDNRIFMSVISFSQHEKQINIFTVTCFTCKCGTVLPGLCAPVHSFCASAGFHFSIS